MCDRGGDRGGGRVRVRVFFVFSIFTSFALTVLRMAHMRKRSTTAVLIIHMNALNDILRHN